MFTEKLKTAVNEWLTNEDLNEWYFESFRDENCKLLPPQEAFESIDKVIPILLNQTDESVLIELAEVILCLARTSGTTEVPSALESNKGLIEAMFSDKCDYAKHKLKEVLGYYRMG